MKIYPTEEEQIEALNANFKRFLAQRVYAGKEIDNESGGHGIIEEMSACMEVNNYNVFSNTNSANNFRGDDQNPSTGNLFFQLLDANLER